MVTWGDHLQQNILMSRVGDILSAKTNMVSMLIKHKAEIGLGCMESNNNITLATHLMSLLIKKYKCRE